jgi:hypothetical protein
MKKLDAQSSDCFQRASTLKKPNQGQGAASGGCIPG